MRKKKILFVYTDMILGGSTTSLLSLLSEIDTERYDVDLILYKNQGEMLSGIPESIHLLPEAFEAVYQSKIRKAIKFLVSGFLWKSVLQNFRYNKKIGFSGQVEADARVSLFCRRIDKTYDVAIGYLEGWPDKYIASDKVSADKKIGWLHVDYAKSYLIPQLDSKSINSLDKVVSVSELCRSNNAELFSKTQHCYLPNILSTKHVCIRAAEEPTDSEFNNWRNCSKLKLITVCRLNNQHKGIDRSVKSAAFLKDKGIQFQWLIIGEGVDQEEIRQQIMVLGIQDCVFLPGAKINPLPYVKQADLFVLTSRYEGKPMVITEALMLGVPVFVTEYSSAREQINDGVDGIIVSNQDEGIGEALYTLISDRNKMLQLKHNVCSNQYGNAEDINRYYELFEE